MEKYNQLEKHLEWLNDEYSKSNNIDEKTKLLDERRKVLDAMRETLSAGRPKLGTKRSVSLTLPNETWEQIDKIIADQQGKLGSVIRDLVLQSLSEK